jgi:hypothetical protein
MANGFRLAGGSYVRQSGSAGNSGLTDALPKQTITQAATVGSIDIIVLSGDYTESAFSNTAKKIIADGNVRVKGVNPLSSTFTGIPNNLTLQGFLTVTFPISTVGSNTTIIDCANVVFATGTAYAINNIVFVNCPNISINTTTANWTNGITLINSVFESLTNNPNISNMYVDYYSVLKLQPTTHYLINCNVNGLALRSGVYYAVPKGADISISGGTATVGAFSARTETYPVLATEWLHVGVSQTATACYVTNGNFNKDPKYVDVANYNFDLLYDSPHVNKSIGGQYRRVVTQSVQTLATGFTDLVDMTGTTNLIPSSTSGSALSPVITLNASTPKIVGMISYGGERNYNITSAGNTAGINDNVPFVGTYNKNGSSTTNTGCRLCVRVRFSNKNTTPSASTDSDWDNGNNNTTPITGILAGEWFLAEINQIFKYDSNGYGNGDYRFSAGNAAQIRAKYVQTAIVLVDNYSQG